MEVTVMHFVYALIFTTIVVMVDVFTKGVKSFYIYIIFYLLFLFSQVMFTSKGHAEEIMQEHFDNFTYEMTDAAKKDIAELTKWMEQASLYKRLTSVQTAEYTKQIKFHKSNAVRTFNDAKARC